MSAVSSSGSPDLPVDDTHVDDRLDPKPLSQRGGQQRPGVGDRVVVIEADDEGEGTAGGRH
jgi:hypothetical protein